MGKILLIYFPTSEEGGFLWPERQDLGKRNHWRELFTNIVTISRFLSCGATHHPIQDLPELQNKGILSKDITDPEQEIELCQKNKAMLEVDDDNFLRAANDESVVTVFFLLKVNILVSAPYLFLRTDLYRETTHEAFPSIPLISFCLNKEILVQSNFWIVSCVVETELRHFFSVFTSEM